jgi:hypothetical protein
VAESLTSNQQFISTTLVRGLLVFLYAVLFLLTCHNPFFWDTAQLASGHANWFYAHGFSSVLLPPEMDSGHPPFLGYLLALAWTFFGKNLLVGHCLMLPFIAIIFYQSTRLVQRIFPPKFHWLGLAILLTDATLLSQCTLVSPDVILIAFFLMGINGLFYKSRFLLCVAATVLCIVSMRGMMVAFSLGLAYFLFSLCSDKIQSPVLILLKLVWCILPFVLGIAMAGWFLVFHYHKTGWIGYHEGSPWADCFERVGVVSLVKNLAVLAWRCLDFGKVGVVLAGIIALGAYWRKKVRPTEDVLLLTTLVLCCFFVLALPLVQYKTMLAHRYLTPFLLLFSLLAGLMLTLVLEHKTTILWAIAIVAIQLSGNFWTYPEGVSMGWDSTLAHLPYFQTREKMLQDIQAKGIPFSQIGTDFPNDLDFETVDLKMAVENFKSYNFARNRYILYSNVFNGFSDEEITDMGANWKVLAKEESWLVKMILYERP